MKRKNSTFILIFSTIAAIAAMGLFIFFLKVIENKNIHTSATLVTLQDKLKAEENAQLFAEKMSEIKLLQESINNYFVDPNKIDIFVSSLEEIGSDIGSSVSVKSIEVPKSIKDTISFSVLINGTFDQVMKTITYLENLPYQVNITKVYLNKDIEQNTENILSKDKIIKSSTWQADITFSILSIN